MKNQVNSQVNSQENDNKKTDKKRISVGKVLVGILIGILVVMLSLAAGFYFLYQQGKKELLQAPVRIKEAPVLKEAEVELEVEDEGNLVRYNGKKYRFNENVTSILFIGTDREDITKETEVIGSSGQADALYLLTIDVETGKITLMAISRDSMTDIDIYDVDGSYLGKQHAQVCLSYAYGDGGAKSCENTVEAVSGLLYGMPINSYVAIDLNSIPLLNDAVGGVDVEIRDEWAAFAMKCQVGDIVHLEGERARAFVQTRNSEDWAPVDANNSRMARQKQFLLAFAKKVLEESKKDITVPISLFNKVSDYMVTNLNLSRVSYLSSIVVKMGFGENNMVTVPGEAVMGDEYAEYHVDEKALYEIILDTFYIEAE